MSRLGGFYKTLVIFWAAGETFKQTQAPYPHSLSHRLDLAYGISEQKAVRIKEFWFWWKVLKLISYENKIYLIKVSQFLNFFFDDLTCGMSYRLDLDLKSFTGTAFRRQIFYRNGVPDRSGLLSPLLTALNNYKKQLRSPGVPKPGRDGGDISPQKFKYGLHLHFLQKFDSGVYLSAGLHLNAGKKVFHFWWRSFLFLLFTWLAHLKKIVVEVHPHQCWK